MISGTYRTCWHIFWVYSTTFQKRLSPFKERDGVGSGRAGSGRVGPGREYSDFSLKYERTRSARCARSLVTIRYPHHHSIHSTYSKTKNVDTTQEWQHVPMLSFRTTRYPKYPRSSSFCVGDPALSLVMGSDTDTQRPGFIKVTWFAPPSAQLTRWWRGRNDVIAYRDISWVLKLNRVIGLTLRLFCFGRCSHVINVMGVV